jgi:TniQ
MLVRPLPLPDELDRGYLGRIMRINGLRTEKDAMEQLTDMLGLGHMTRREQSCLEPLSLVAGLTLEQFTQAHSTLPLRRAITSYLPDLAHGSATRRSILHFSGMALARPGAYFCAHCVSEDVAFHGVSYWRRDHQLPGQLWCPKHNTTLHYMEEDAAFLDPPAKFLTVAETVPVGFVDESRNNTYVARFIDITAGLIVRGAPIDVKYVALALREQAAAKGLQTTGGKVKKPLLSDRLQDSYPTHWLNTVFSSLVHKPHGQILNQIDGVLYMQTSASSVTSYILACAVLYDSADMALNSLVGASTEFADRPGRVTLAPTVTDTRALLAAYTDSLGNQAAVARKLAMPFHQARSMLNSAGLPNLHRSRISQRNMAAAASAFYLQGKSIAESAAIGDLTVVEMEELVRKSGVNLAGALQSFATKVPKRRSMAHRTKGVMPREGSTSGCALGPDQRHATTSAIESNIYSLATEFQN